MKKSIGPKTLVYPTPAWCIGTYDVDGKPNVMTVAWGGICCSDPICVTISLREATYSFGNIIERGAYTINIPSEKYADVTDYFGIVSGKKVDKFKTSGLTPVESDLVDAPYIAEFPLILECKVLHSFKLGLHTQFIGEVMDIKAEESILNEKGVPDIKKVNPVTYSPDIGAYYGIGEELGRAYKMGKKVGK
jgi:flavin reductase (DIM6/NTAB) family NADH-FMN oxidoreductase RutF